jgi:hypothetical protein
MHKFHLGQSVTFRAPGGRLFAPPGAYVVTAKLPERDGEFEYHIRSTSEQHERVALESELSALRETESSGERAKGKR